MNAETRNLVQPVMRTFFALGLIALIGAPIAAQSRIADETEHVSKRIKLDPGGTLRLKSFSGRVTIVAADAPDVVIEAIRRAPRSRLDRIKLDIHTEGAAVVVDANQRERSWYEFTGNNVVETDFDIKVPRRTNLDVSVFSAPVTIEGVEGSHVVHSFSSRLSLSDVAGPVKAHSFSGPIVVRQNAWGPDSAVDADTFSGSIEVHVPENAKADVSFSSFSGRLNSDLPLTLRTGRRSALTAELGGGGGGTLKFKTFSGSVKIDR